MIQTEVRSIAADNPQYSEPNNNSESLNSAELRTEIVEHLSIKSRVFRARETFSRKIGLILSARQDQRIEEKVAKLEESGISRDEVTNHWLKEVEEMSNEDRAAYYADHAEKSQLEYEDVRDNHPDLSEERQTVSNLEQQEKQFNIQGKISQAKLSTEKLSRTEKEARAIGSLREINIAQDQLLEANLLTLSDIVNGKFLSDETRDTALANRRIRNVSAINANNQTARVLESVYKIRHPNKTMQGEWFREGRAEMLYKESLRGYLSSTDSRIRNSIYLQMHDWQIRIEGGYQALQSIYHRTDIDDETKLQLAMELTDFANLSDLSETDGFYIEDQIGMPRNESVWQ